MAQRQEPDWARAHAGAGGRGRGADGTFRAAPSVFVEGRSRFPDRLLTRLQKTDDVPNGGLFSCAFDNLGKRSVRRRGQLHSGLLRFEHHHVLVPDDSIALGFEPLADFNFGDRFTHGRYFQFYSHVIIVT